MNFHETVRGQRFFDVQLPKLISSLSEVAEQMKTPHPTIPVETTEDTQELLVQLYYSTFDREAAPDREIHDRFNQAISQMQAEIKDEVGSELWQKIEHTYAMIATRTGAGVCGRLPHCHEDGDLWLDPAKAEQKRRYLRWQHTRSKSLAAPNARTASPIRKSFPDGRAV